MLKKVLAAINKYKMIESGDHIIVGLSGGADSCALLAALCLLKEELSLTVTAVHINHSLRGEEADGDEAFSKNLSESLGVGFISEKIDVDGYARENGLGTEEAGRIIRYEVFERIRLEKGASKIAVAHNLNDRAETVIMRIARGSGIKGLVGISPVRGNIIRPLIDCERSEIEAFCRKNDIAYRTDSTNNEDIYTRNKLRLNIMPLIIEELNKNAVSNIVKTAELAAEDNSFLEEETEKAFNACIINTFEKNNVYFDVCKLKSYHKAIIKRVILKAIVIVTGAKKDIYSKNIEDVYDLLYKGTGKSLDLPYGSKAEMIYDTLKIGKNENKENKKAYYKLDIGKKTYIEEIKKYVLISEKEEKNSIKGTNLCTKSFSCAKIKDSLYFRTRKEGDILRLFPDGGRKKLKDFFIDKKIPRAERDKLLFFAAGSEVIWIPDIWYSKYHGCDDYAENVLYIYIWEDA